MSFHRQSAGRQSASIKSRPRQSPFAGGGDELFSRKAVSPEGARA
jgi:hypothetical protein